MKVVTRARGLLEKGKTFPVFFHVRVSYLPIFRFSLFTFYPDVLFLTLSCARLCGIYRLLLARFLTATHSRRLCYGQTRFTRIVA
jgi:hypothetical protein